MHLRHSFFAAAAFAAILLPAAAQSKSATFSNSVDAYFEVPYNDSVGLVAGSLLILSSRWHWLGEIAASFSWHFGLAGLAGAVLLALVGRRRLGLAAAALALVHAGPELLLWLPGADAREPELTVATFNMQWGNREFGALDEWLDWADADVVCLQEVAVESREHLEQLRAEYPYVSHSPVADRWNVGTWGTLVLSRTPFLSTRLLEAPETIERPSMEVSVDLGGEALTLRTAHPPRPGRGERTLRRNLVLRQLAGEDWGGHGALLGDLNVTSTSPVFREILATSGLRDSRAGRGRQPTWTTSKHLAGLEIAIDHVLVTDGLAVTSRRFRSVEGSDHRGVVVGLARLAK